MNSFPKESRLLNSEDFNYLRKGATCLNTPYLRFYFKNSKMNSTQSRLGLSVSRKAGNAVRRNYIKRFLREQFRLSGWVNLGDDILIVASPRLKTLPRDREQFRDCISKSWELGIKKRMFNVK